MPSLNTEESASLYNHILIGSMSLHGDWIQEAKLCVGKKSHVLESDKLRLLSKLHHLLNRFALHFSSVKW